MYKGGARKKNLKDILLDNKLLTEAQLNEVMAEATRAEQPLQQVVINKKLVDKLELLQVLSAEWNVRAIDLSEIEVDPDVIRIIPENTSRRHLAVPFAKEESVLFVAMANPRDFFVSEDIHLRTGYEVQSYLSLPDDINKTLDKVYGAKEGEVLQKVLDNIGREHVDLKLDDSISEEKVDISDIDVSAPEVEKIVNAIILEALQRKASDIHVEPFENKLMVRFRVDGVLHDAKFQPPFSYRFALMAKIKIMTQQMDITERRKPQDGRIQILSAGKPVEFRVNIIPTVFGESCVMRILDRASVRVEMDKMGFLPDTLEKFKASIAKPYGLVLVCGPTGSGKTTTLYSLLKFVHDSEKNLITVEDPVEYQIQGVNQVTVRSDVGLTFASSLRSILRQDPDVIMIGEIRDFETVDIAIKSALTGHLVLSTLHTTTACGSVVRLVNMGVEPFLISASLISIVAQRLIRKLCDKCKEPYEPIPSLVSKLGMDPKEKKITFYRPKGCEKCMNTGYKGRVGICEILSVSPAIKEMILKKARESEMKEQARKEKMRTLREDGMIKVMQGLTSLEEILRVTIADE